MVANQAKSAFLAAASHKLRTTMSAVLGLTGLLPEEDRASTQRHLAHAIRTSGEAPPSRLDPIRDFSGIEGGHFEPGARPRRRMGDGAYH
ncbi:MAG: histidine kinase dimerization/phospho-acceptor domain-containing protein [Gemmatimonadota bacterium]